MSPRSRQWIGLICIVLLAACSTQASAGENEMEHAEADRLVAAAVVEPGADGAIEAEAEPPKETCDGALDCTFFGVGAVLAAPFWVLGAFLGLVF